MLLNKNAYHANHDTLQQHVKWDSDPLQPLSLIPLMLLQSHPLD